MLYIEIAWMTAFNRISFSACDKNSNFQSLSRLQTRSLMLLNACFQDFPTKASNPRYLSYLCVEGIPNNLNISI
jgi:hypothetical protein